MTNDHSLLNNKKKYDLQHIIPKTTTIFFFNIAHWLEYNNNLHTCNVYIIKFYEHGAHT